MKPLVLLLFFLSGACGLVYEVVWTRLLTHVFGTTALAVGTVLAAFMSGLAVGAWLLGRMADKSPNPLRLYARLEIGLGLAALLAHLLLQNIDPVYVGLYEWFGRSDAMLGVARFALAFVLVMAPTILMGATLPVLARFVVRHRDAVGAGLSTLYSINTIGAVAGTLLTGFFLIEAAGLNGSIVVAVLGNVGIGAIAWVVGGRAGALPVTAPDDDAPAREADTSEVSPRGYRWLLIGLALSGLTSFAYEIYWTRSLVFLVGNSTYAVTTMLATFLGGIALGGFLARFLVDRVRARVALFGWVQVLIGVTAAIALPLLFGLVEPEEIRVRMGLATHDASRLIMTRFGLSVAVMLLPATLIGTTFPLVARIGVTDLRRTGTSVGATYAANTVGNVLGALLPGLVLLHWLGIQRGLLVMAGLNALVGFVALAARMRHGRSLRWAVPVGLAASLAAFALVPVGFRFPAEGQTEWHRELFYREGPSATTTVLFDPETGARFMAVDGVEIGGNGITEYKQQLLAHVPKLLSDDVSLELSIGLGSGMLAGESLRHARVERIVCVEIEPSVVAGARLFPDENRGVFDDPRVDLVVDDVATHLLTTPDRYAVVSADEKTAQDYASNGFSYSREYYELLRSRLAPGGLVIQWVPTTLPASQYAMVLRTFSASFPHTLLFYGHPALQDGAVNTLLVGSSEDLDLRLDDMRRRWNAAPESFAGLAPYGLTAPEDLLAQFVADGPAIRAAVARAPENTLDRPRYEFYSFADYSVPRIERLAANHRLLMSLRRDAAQAFLAHVADQPTDVERLGQAFAAESEFLGGIGMSLAGEALQTVLARFEAALGMAPWARSLRARISFQYWQAGTAHVSMGDHRRAAELMQRALTLHGASPIAHVIHSTILTVLGETERAIEQATIAVDLDPDLVAARRMLADVLLLAGRTSDAAGQLRALLAIEPDDVAAKEMFDRL